MKLVIPSKVLAQHVAVLGKTGSGKSSAMRYMIEGMLDDKQPVCIVDPKGDWWGLKSSADGISAGYEMVIFGGSHADVPIDVRAGASVAELVATGNRPAIIDLGGWTVHDRTKFFIDFAQGIFNKTRGLRWLAIDEVHNFAPKGKIMSPEAGMMLHWANRLASEGRGKGINLIVASQRPQKVHNDLLTSCETLISMRVIHPRDREAIAEWLEGAGDKAKAAEVLSSLASMKRGEGWVWSPEIEFGPERVVFPMFKTFDSFAALANSNTVKLKGWAEVNLDEVRLKLAETIEKSKADDPKELRRRIMELEKEKRDRPATPPVEKLVEKIVEVPALKDDEVDGLRDLGGQLIRLGGALVKSLDAIAAAGHARALRPSPPRHVSTPPALRVNGHARAPSVLIADGLGKRTQRFLDAAASLQALGVETTRETVAAWVGVHPRGGSVGEELSGLVDRGFITLDRGQIQVTREGLASANHVDAESAIAQAKSGLTNRQRNFFELIETAGGEGTTREAIAETVGIHPRGGSLGEDLGRLVGRGLVSKDRGVYRLRDFLLGVRR